MSLKTLKPRKILVRSTNWVGDAIMTTPAVRTIRENFPDATISMLAYPWVADIFVASPHVDEVILYQKKKEHQGLKGMWRLSRELAARSFDMAILLQNAFEAALIAKLARIPVRAGYKRDGRGVLLTHGVAIRKSVKKLHHVHYYQTLLADLGLKPGPDDLFLQLPEAAARWAGDFAAPLRPSVLVGLNPGAAYGPAKRWPAEKYGRLAARLHRELAATILVFGTGADTEAARIIKGYAPDHVVDVTGRTTLAQAMALIGLCDGFVTNDSGLMHVAAATRTPLVAIFGSTNAVATGPFSPNAKVLEKDLDCRPCMKTDCKADFQCMLSIGVDEVFEALSSMLGRRERREQEKD